MKNFKTTHFAFIACATLAPLTGCANPNATFKVRVIDDDGKPIIGVRAEVANIYDMDCKPGLTDINGMHSVHLDKIYEVKGWFEKNGYYKTQGVFWNASNWGDIPPADTNFTIVLKRIINPVLMREKKVDVIFPYVDEPVGFDLEVGDWVFPNGKGKTTDVLMTAQGYYTSERDYSFKMIAEFIGDLNGIQTFYFPKGGAGSLLRSELPPPAIAPESGYKKTFECFEDFIPPNKWASMSFTETQKWIFRVRTKINENDEIESANYGWMTSDISFGPNFGTGRIIFKYYYNPDSKSRSLEPKEIADRQGKNLQGGEE